MFRNYLFSGITFICSIQYCYNYNVDMSISSGPSIYHGARSEALVSDIGKNISYNMLIRSGGMYVAVNTSDIFFNSLDFKSNYVFSSSFNDTSINQYLSTAKISTSSKFNYHDVLGNIKSSIRVGSLVCGFNDVLSGNNFCIKHLGLGVGRLSYRFAQLEHEDSRLLSNELLQRSDMTLKEQFGDNKDKDEDDIEQLSDRYPFDIATKAERIHPGIEKFHESYSFGISTHISLKCLPVRIGIDLGLYFTSHYLDEFCAFVYPGRTIQTEMPDLYIDTKQIKIRSESVFREVVFEKESNSLITGRFCSPSFGRCLFMLSIPIEYDISDNASILVLLSCIAVNSSNNDKNEGILVHSNRAKYLDLRTRSDPGNCNLIDNSDKFADKLLLSKNIPILFARFFGCINPSNTFTVMSASVGLKISYF